MAMLFTNQASIQEVLFFPQMKPEKKIEVNLSAEATGILESLQKQGKTYGTPIDQITAC